MSSIHLHHVQPSKWDHWSIQGHMGSTFASLQHTQLPKTKQTVRTLAYQEEVQTPSTSGTRNMAGGLFCSWWSGIGGKTRRTIWWPFFSSPSLWRIYLFSALHMVHSGTEKLVILNDNSINLERVYLLWVHLYQWVSESFFNNRCFMYNFFFILCKSKIMYVNIWLWVVWYQAPTAAHRWLDFLYNHHEGGCAGGLPSWQKAVITASSYNCRQ